MRFCLFGALIYDLTNYSLQNGLHVSICVSIINICTHLLHCLNIKLYFLTFLETKPVPPEYDTDIMKLLQKHARNDERELRNQLPDLNECVK